MASDAEPLSEKGEAYLQESIDRYHAMFIEMVAVGRGITPEVAQEKFGDGKVHLAAQALEIGMIDHIGTLAETIGFGVKQEKVASRASNINEKILAALENENETSLSGAGNLDSPADYLAAVDAYATENKVGKIAAMKAINKK